MGDRLVILGAKGGPAIRPGSPNPTSMLLELAGQGILVDCGLGVTRGLVDAGFDLRNLKHVFVTHLHSDHVLELGPLVHTAWTAGLAGVVNVYAPMGLVEYWGGFMASMAYDNAIRVSDEGRVPLADLVRLNPLAEGQAIQLGELSAAALRVWHPPVDDCFALRFDGGGKSVTFSSDTAHFPPLADFARGSDILVHEAMLPEGVEAIIARTGLGDALRLHMENSHSTAAQAAAIARDAAVGRLVLNHLIPADDPAFAESDWLDAVAPVWDGLTSVARDGLEIEF
jgi:ribonuclease BN (tRNA processing enzyme)